MRSQVCADHWNSSFNNDSICCQGMPEDKGHGKRRSENLAGRLRAPNTSAGLYVSSTYFYSVRKSVGSAPGLLCAFVLPSASERALLISRRPRRVYSSRSAFRFHVSSLHPDGVCPLGPDSLRSCSGVPTKVWPTYSMRRLGSKGCNSQV
jgi:hypothetical protein